MSFLCRIGIHRYREVGIMGRTIIGLTQVLEQCTRCDRGRVFHAIGGYYSIVPPEVMRKAKAEHDAQQADR